MNKTGFAFGQCLQFTNGENERVVGYVIRPTNLDRPCDHLYGNGAAVISEREYSVIHCDRIGNPVFDRNYVPESYIRPYGGWIPDDVARIPKVIQELIEKHIPPGPVTDE